MVMMMVAAGCTAFLPWAAFVKCHRGAKFTFTNDSTPAPVHYITSHYITLQMLNHQTLTIRLNPLSISDLSLVAPNIQGCTCKPTFQCKVFFGAFLLCIIYNYTKCNAAHTFASYLQSAANLGGMTKWRSGKSTHLQIIFDLHQ